MPFGKFAQQSLGSRRVLAASVAAVGATTLAMADGMHRESVAAWLDPVRSLVRPVSEGLFGG